MKKVVLVTGGNRGLGLQLCKELTQEGFEVILSARSKQNATDQIHLIKSIDPNAAINFCELVLDDEESIKNAKTWIEEKYGRLDVLVNNAAILVDSKSTTEVTMDEIEKSLRTNFYGPFLLSQTMLPLLKKSKGKIINVSSRMGSFNEMNGGYAAYRLSKTILNSLTVIMANDVAQLGVRAVAVCPGWVKTDMGGNSAPRSLEEGTSGIKWLVTEDEFESGKFYRDKHLIDF